MPRSARGSPPANLPDLVLDGVDWFRSVGAAKSPGTKLVSPVGLETIAFLNDVIGAGSLCGLGRMAPNPVRALLLHFSDKVHELCAANAASAPARLQRRLSPPGEIEA